MRNFPPCDSFRYGSYCESNGARYSKDAAYSFQSIQFDDRDDDASVEPVYRSEDYIPCYDILIIPVFALCNDLSVQWQG